MSGASQTLHTPFTTSWRLASDTMNTADLDITHEFVVKEGLPRPVWERIEPLVVAQGADGERAAWLAVCRQWLSHLAAALGERYRVEESEHFFVLAVEDDGLAGRLLAFAERCRVALMSVLQGVADFDIPGKDVVLAFRRADDYYRYIAPRYPEGEHAASGGVQIRDGYPHVALNGTNHWAVEAVLAHELTHLCLVHLTMPRWVEEGLTQLFEHEMTAMQQLVVTEKLAARHKRYWSKHGLDEFWRGRGFSRPGKVQKLSYQLAEIMMRLLLDDPQPGWFGRRGARERFIAFLRAADAADAGEAAARAHLGTGIQAIAERFLGPLPSPPPP